MGHVACPMRHRSLASAGVTAYGRSSCMRQGRPTNGVRVKISVTGCGYLGAVHAASMAELGHEVVGIDVDAEKVEVLSKGVAPFHEPGFEELLERTLATGRLRFSTDVEDARGSQV